MFSTSRSKASSSPSKSEENGASGGAPEIEYVRGFRLNSRKKDVSIYLKYVGSDEDEWEPLAELEEAGVDLSKVYEFQSTIDHLKHLATKNFTSQQVNADDDDEADEYEVEQVLGVSVNTNDRRIEYYIKWRDWDNMYNNWEAEAGCYCPEFTDPYKETTEKLRAYFKLPAVNKSKKNTKKFTKRASTPRSTSRQRKTPSRAAKTLDSPSTSPSNGKTKHRPPPTASPSLDDTMDDVANGEDSDDLDDCPPKRPGPKSRTLTISSRKPGPKSRSFTASQPAGPSRKMAKLSSTPSPQLKNSSSLYIHSASESDFKQQDLQVGMITGAPVKPKSFDESSSEEGDELDYLGKITKPATPQKRSRVKKEKSNEEAGTSKKTSSQPTPPKKRPGPKSRTMPLAVEESKSEGEESESENGYAPVAGGSVDFNIRPGGDDDDSNTTEPMMYDRDEGPFPPALQCEETKHSSDTDY